MTDYLATARMMVDALKPKVLAGNAIIAKVPSRANELPSLGVEIPLATATTILQHLERLAKLEEGGTENITLALKVEAGEALDHIRATMAEVEVHRAADHE